MSSRWFAHMMSNTSVAVLPFFVRGRRFNLDGGLARHDLIQSLHFVHLLKDARPEKGRRGSEMLFIPGP